jgi:hypothetical protein
VEIRWNDVGDAFDLECNFIVASCAAVIYDWGEPDSIIKKTPLIFSCYFQHSCLDKR